MSRTTVGSLQEREERDALLELADAEDSLYAAANCLLRANLLLGDACGVLAQGVGKLISGIEERGKKR